MKKKSKISNFIKEYRSAIKIPSSTPKDNQTKIDLIKIDLEKVLKELKKS